MTLFWHFFKFDDIGWIVVYNRTRQCIIENKENDK